MVLWFGIMAAVTSSNPISRARSRIGICWPSGTCQHEAQRRWMWLDRIWSLSGWRTGAGSDLQPEEHEVGMDPQRRPSASPLARSEGRLEKTHWTEDERSKGLEDSDRRVADKNIHVGQCQHFSPTYPVDTVGVADSWDGFGLRVGGWDWSRAVSG